MKSQLGSLWSSSHENLRQHSPAPKQLSGICSTYCKIVTVVKRLQLRWWWCVWLGVFPLPGTWCLEKIRGWGRCSGCGEMLQLALGPCVASLLCPKRQDVENLDSQKGMRPELFIILSLLLPPSLLLFLPLFLSPSLWKASPWLHPLSWPWSGLLVSFCW